MLVLTRKVGEALQIGENIRITVIEVDGANVKLGINAPRSVAIHREEVYRKIQEQNRAAVAMSGADLGALANLFKPKSPES